MSPESERVGGASYWDSRARRYAARQTLEAALADPFLRRLRRVTGRRSTVVDVGAGHGRFTLPLAPRVGEVIAVDPSSAMLGLLAREARRRRITSIRCVNGLWEEVDTPVVDLAFSSFVLALVQDAPRFLGKMDTAARRRALLYLSAFSNDALLDPLWRHFHGQPRRPAPTYLDAVAVLREMGMTPSVDVVHLRNPAEFGSLREAVSDYRRQLLLPATREVRSELRELLAGWLVRKGDRFLPPLRVMPAAIIEWTPRGGT